MRFAALMTGLILLLSAPAAQAARPVPYPLYTSDNITIETSHGEVELFVEVAKSAMQKEHGLMFRTHLSDRSGMIFLFNQEAPLEMWMKNTLISLDMLFVNRNGEIINIVQNTNPQSEAHIPSGGGVSAVIEIAGGSAARLQIAKGDKVVYPFFHE